MAKRRNKSSGMYFEKRKPNTPFRRSIFVHNSQEQDRSTRRLNMMIRTVISILLLAVIVIFLIFIFGYLIPFLQKEFASNTTKSDENASSVYIEPNPVYDTNGLQIYDDDITLFMINVDNPAEADIKPKTKKVSGVEVSEYMAPSLELLIEAAKSDGLLLELSQGYISYEDQGKLYDGQVNRLIQENNYSNVMARTDAKKTVPMSGESDYQTGMCVLLKNNPEEFAQSTTYLWLNRNMADYGFVFRYPADKESETGMEGNLCVLRYVGKENATRMRQLSMCMEEYVQYLNNQQG